MPIHTTSEAEARLRDPAPLTQEEIRDLMPHMTLLSTGAVRRLEAEQALQNLQAIRLFDASSQKIGRWSLWLNIALFFLTVAAVVIAIGSYRAAEHSSAQQQKTLDASRGALEAAVKSLQSLTSVAEDFYKREAERERRQPKVEVSFRQSLQVGSSETKLAATVHKFELIGSPAKIFFLVRNFGTAPVAKPTYLLTATPSTVRVICAAEFPQGRPSTDPNRCQFNGIRDIAPMSVTKMPDALGVELQFPDGTSEFNLEFALWGVNLAQRRFLLHFVIARP